MLVMKSWSFVPESDELLRGHNREEAFDISPPPPPGRGQRLVSARFNRGAFRALFTAFLSHFFIGAPYQ